MGRLTIVLIPEGASTTKQFSIPKYVLRVLSIGGFFFFSGAGYLFFDYFQLIKIRQSYYRLADENEGLKGEARLIMHNLEDVKRSLRRVQDYSTKLGELTQLRVRQVSKKTGIEMAKGPGIGPLTEAESEIAKQNVNSTAISNYVPLGINLDNLVFRPVFDRLNTIGREANQNALKLQQLLSRLSQQKSLLSSIPSSIPVNGWITSDIGPRVSPFTGKRGYHKGIDVAAPIGTPIFAPADGVVIFAGAKVGYGNFIMLAHGYGVVTRYGHNAQNMVQPGQRLKRGDQIGTVGMTGRTTGPHVHYEIMVNGKHYNPRRFILNIAD